MNVNLKDLASGIFFIAVGLIYGGMAVLTLPMGNAAKMGPGDFPALLSACLVGLGLLIALRSFKPQSRDPIGAIPWRAIMMLSTATIVFAAFLDKLGLFPVVLVVVFLASKSSSQISSPAALVSGAAISAFCVLIFSYGIHLPVPIFGTWFAF